MSATQTTKEVVIPSIRNGFVAWASAVLGTNGAPLTIFVVVLICIGMLIVLFFLICYYRFCCTKGKNYRPTYHNIPFIYIDELPGHEEGSKIGILEFSIEYSVKNQSLAIQLIQGINLQAPPGIDTLDTYVRVSLEIPEPETKHFFIVSEPQVYNTGVREKSLSPCYNESFEFKIPYNQLKDCKLKFSIFDYDPVSVENIVGSVILKMKDIPMEYYLGTRYELKEELIRDTNFVPSQLCTVLLYNPTKAKLYVEILEAKNLHLPMQKNGTYPDVFVSITLKMGKKVLSKQRTSTRNNTCEPYFGEKFSFSIDCEKMDTAMICCSIKYRSPIKLKKKLGNVCIGKQDAFLSGIKQWKEILEYPMRPSAIWHTVDTLKKKGKH